MAYLGPKRIVDLVLKLEDWPGCVLALGAFDPVIQSALQGVAPFNVKPLPFNPMGQPHPRLDPAAERTLPRRFSDFRLPDAPMTPIPRHCEERSDEVIQNQAVNRPRSFRNRKN